MLFIVRFPCTPVRLLTIPPLSMSVEKQTKPHKHKKPNQQKPHLAEGCFSLYFLGKLLQLQLVSGRMALAKGKSHLIFQSSSLASWHQ